jgi:hypothetical protein
VAWGHDPGVSTTEIQIDPAEVRLRVGFAAADLQPLLPAGLRFTGAWTDGRMAAARADLLRIAGSLWTVGGDSGEVAMLGAIVSLTPGKELKFDLRYPRPPGDHLHLRLDAFDRLPPGHRDFLTWNAEGGRSRFDALLSAGAPAAVMPLPPPPPETPAGLPARFRAAWSRHDPWVRWGVYGLASILALAGLARLIRLIRNRWVPSGP